MKNWSTLAKVVYKRTYARNDFNKLENWNETIDRIIKGNLNLVDSKYIEKNEEERLKYFFTNRKALPAGRGLWFSGAPAQDKIGGAALVNCWAVTSEEWKNFIIAMDLLMLGGGVSLSIEHRFTSKLSKVKKNVEIVHQLTKDADTIVPDSRQGWCDLVSKVFESFFETGKSFSYSTICLRGAGEKINGFGGKSSGPLPLVKCVEKINTILKNREGKHVRPIDAMDLICSIGEMVVSGNVRRSAILIHGDPWDKEFLQSKRWDLGPIPTERAMANLSVICDDISDLHPLFWKTYEQGEPFGIINRKNIQKYGRMGEKLKDTAYLTNPCAEATLENYEPCNLTELFLPNLKNENEFLEAARLMFRWAKRVTLAKYHHPENAEVIKRNGRVGVGITGCLQSDLFNVVSLDKAYDIIQKENISYSKQLNVNESIRTTLVKPSGTLSLLGDCTAGIHPAFSRYYIRRVRFSANDSLIPILRKAGHKIEPVIRFDGSLDHNTLVVDFYCEAKSNTPTVDEGFDTWKQLETFLFAQKHWADQAVSVTVYYKKEEISKIKEWLNDNLQNLKTISFLSYNDHGFLQAPLEKISKEEYEQRIQEITQVNMDEVTLDELNLNECENGACPVK